MASTLLCSCSISLEAPASFLGFRQSKKDGGTLPGFEGSGKPSVPCPTEKDVSDHM